MATGEDESLIRIKVEGMSCNHCVSAVKRALEESSGVEKAEVNLKAGRADVAGKDVDPSLLVDKIRQLGYDARVIE